MTTTDIATSRKERAGWYAYDWANSAFPTTVVTAFLGPYLTGIAEAGADANDYIDVYGLSIKAGALWPYATSLSVILQVFVMPVIGAMADRTDRKKRLLVFTAYTGAIATCGLMFVTDDRYLLGAWLFLIANVAFGASVVVYNSFLPQISTSAERDAVSSRGWAIGYLGGGTLLLLNVIAVALGGEEYLAETARWSLVSAGVWWAGFTSMTVAWLHDRPAVEGAVHRGSVLVDGFRQFWRTFKGMRHYPLSVFFLIAFLVYNDGIQTVFAMAGTYGAKELGFDNTALMPVILIVQFVAFGGALFMGWLAKLFGAKATVLGSLLVWLGIVVFAYFVPAGNFGMLLAMGVGIGLVLGGSQALSRSMFSQLIPEGKEGEYFGVYEISDRGTSWMGPLLFGLAFDMTGSYRVAILSLIVFFIVGFVLLLLVPMRRAIIAAGNTPPHKV